MPLLRQSAPRLSGPPLQAHLSHNCKIPALETVETEIPNLLCWNIRGKSGVQVLKVFQGPIYLRRTGGDSCRVLPVGKRRAPLPGGGPEMRTQASARPTRVLIVDDDRRVLNFLEIKLRISGYAVATADNGAAALRKMASFGPDVLVMDVAMPGKDGFQTLREARSFTRAPAILMSAYDVDKSEMKDLGRVQYLAKPFNPDELLSRIRALCRPEDMGYAA